MWAQLINTILGIWLMAAPAILDYGGHARTNHHIVGPLAVSCGVIALWEVTRPLRWGNLALGLWLLVSAWVVASPWVVVLSSSLVGVLLSAFGFVGGGVDWRRYGGGWSVLWQAIPPSPREGGCSTPSAPGGITS